MRIANFINENVRWPELGSGRSYPSICYNKPSQPITSRYFNKGLKAKILGNHGFQEGISSTRKKNPCKQGIGVGRLNICLRNLVTANNK